MTTQTPRNGQPGKACGCPDFELSRRRFLGGVAAATGTMTAASLFGDAYRQVAYGAPDGNVLVVLSFRGGSDGLSIIVPKNAVDQGVITKLRSNIKIPYAGLLGGNADWGLHPAMAPLVPMWTAGTFGAVHAVGLPTSNMSHFDAMEELELANPGSNRRQGWINRMIGLDDAALPEEMMQLGDSMLPTALVGDAGALGAYQVTDLTLPGLWNDQHLSSSIRTMWGGHRTTLNDGVRTAIGSVGRLRPVADTTDDEMNEARGNYPEGALQNVLANTALLIKANVGAKMITIDYGNWDMHTELGNDNPQEGQWMWDQLEHFAASMAAFFTDLGSHADRVTVVTISEFGRRVESNGDFGLDHGYAGLMMAFGAGVNGGEVHGSSGLQLDNLDNDDNIRMQHDYRGVFWEIIQSRFPGAGRRTQIFPGSPAFTATGLMS